MNQHISSVSDVEQLPDHGDSSRIADEAYKHNGGAPPMHLVSHSFLSGSVLFQQGDIADGVFFLHHGRVQLSIDSPLGKSLIVRIAGPGDIIGISAAVNGTKHEATAVALECCEADLTPREKFLRQLHDDPEFSCHVAAELSRENFRLFGLVNSLAGNDTVFVRLARLFASWLPLNNGHHPVTLESRLTHQQIAEMIGTTRETVTRALGEMREQRLVTLKNGELAVHDHARLRLLAEDKTRNGGM